MLPFLIGIFNSASAAGGLTYTGPSYFDSVDGDIPVGFWRLEDTSAPFADSGSGADAFELTGSDITYGVTSPTGTGITIGTADNTYLTNITLDTELATHTEGSIECWFKPNGEDLYIFTLVDDTTYNIFAQVRFHTTTGIISYRYKDNDTLGTNNYRVKNSDPLNITTSDWVHVVVVSHPTGSVLIYVNGASVDITTIEGSPSGKWFSDLPSETTTQSMIHKWDTDQIYSSGSISELAIYDYRLNAGQVLEHYEAGWKIFNQYTNSKAPAPLAYWKMDEAAGKLKDEVNSYELIPVGGFTYNKPSMIDLESWNDCIEFNSADDSHFAMETTPAALQIAGDVSFSCFLKLSNVTTFQNIVTCGHNLETEVTNNQYRLAINADKTLTLHWEYSTGNNEDVNTVSATSISVDTRFHIGFVRDTTNKDVHFYINGDLFETVAYTNNPTGGSSSLFFLGAHGLGGVVGPIIGQMDEAVIYNKMIGSQDMRRIYNKGKVNYDTSVLKGEPVAYWRLDESSSPFANSAYTNTYAMTVSGSDITYDVTGPVPGSEAITVGTSANTYILNTTDLVTELQTHAAGSVECWFKANPADTGNIILLAYSNTAVLNFYTRLMLQPSTNTIQYSFRNNTSTLGTDHYRVKADIPFNITKWNHLVITSDSTTYPRFIVNGELLTNMSTMDGTASGKWFGDYSSALSAVTSFKFDYSGTDSWNAGSMSGLAIHDRVLTVDECRKRYELSLSDNSYETNVLATEPTAYWRMDEASGSITDLVASAVCTTSGTMEYGRTSLTNDPHGGSIYFNDGYFTKATSFQYTGDVSFHCWVTLKDIKGYQQTFVECGTIGETEADNYLYRFALTNVGKLEVLWEYSTGTNEIVQTTSAISILAGVPSHIGFVRNTTNNEVYFFVNGEFIEAISYTNEATGGTASNFSLGKHVSNDSDPMYGTMSDATIYNTIVGEDVFKRLYRIGNSRKIPRYTEVVLSSNPAGFWKFNESASPFLDYGSEGDNFTTSGSTDIIEQAAPPFLGGKGVQIGIANNTRLNNNAFATPLSTHDQGTVELWFRIHPDETENAEFLTASVVTSNSTFMKFYYAASNRLIFYYRNGTGTLGTNYYLVQSDVLNLEAGLWYHIVYVSHDTGSTSMYLNGVSINTSTGGGSPSGKWFSDLGIAPNRVNCFLNDFALTDTWSGGAISNLAVYDYQLSEWDIQHHYLTATKPSIYKPSYKEFINTTNPLFHWEMNEVSGNIVDSISALSLTAGGTLTYSKDPLIREGTSIDVSAGSFTYGTHAPLQITGSMSFHCWVSFNSVTTQQDFLVCGIGGETSATNYCYIFRILSDRKLYLFWEYSSGSDSPITTTVAADVIVGSVNHIGFVRDATAKTVSFYVNGKLLETIGFSNNASGGSSGTFGMFGNLNGIADEAVIYNSTLSADVFSTLYSIGRWHLV